MLNLSILIGRRRSTGENHAQAVHEVSRTARRLRLAKALVEGAKQKRDAAAVIVEIAVAEDAAGESANVPAARRAADAAAAAFRVAEKARDDAAFEWGSAREKLEELTDGLDEVLAMSVSTSSGAGQGDDVIKAYHELISSSEKGRELRAEFGEFLFIVDNQVRTSAVLPNLEDSARREARAAAIQDAADKMAAANTELENLKEKLVNAESRRLSAAEALGTLAPGALVAATGPGTDTGTETGTETETGTGPGTDTGTETGTETGGESKKKAPKKAPKKAAKKTAASGSEAPTVESVEAEIRGAIDNPLEDAAEQAARIEALEKDLEAAIEAEG